ncbi:mutator type transposase [Tanacetum coccineum]|uniref:Mutator type transposase n=1 Tax=Tanacetum coccineum TaxID=301880 RepID=A0ABQ5D7T8_9ASTR
MKVWGDYTKQYALLRDYVLNLQRTNPDTTMNLDVERCFDPSEPTRQFRRIYLCLGTLKKGFKACMGDLLGLYGCFMKGQYPGQLLTAVALGDDLDLTRDSNFSFMSDRQKVIDKSKGPLTPAIIVLFKAITDEASFYKVIGWFSITVLLSSSIVLECVVDVKEKTCSCIQWELTGTPCKHVVAALWDMAGNKNDVGIPESWVHAYYWLVTWEKKITSGGKLSRVGKTVTYYTCKKPGHNKRSCKNGVGGSQSSQRSVATPIASEASAARGSQAVATPITSQRSVVTPRTSQRSAASPRTSQSSAATAKGK